MLHLFFGCINHKGQAPRKNSGRYRLKKRAINCAHCFKIGVAQQKMAMFIVEIFSRDVQYENNDHVGSMHIVDLFGMIRNFTGSTRVLGR